MEREVNLSDAIAALSEEIAKAQHVTKDHGIFNVIQSIEVLIPVEFTKSDDYGSMVEVKLISAEANDNQKSISTVKISLAPTESGQVSVSVADIAGSWRQR